MDCSGEITLTGKTAPRKKISYLHQMDEKYIAILGGLVGSGFTIVVTKIFDYFQTQQLHNLSLKKEFFLRKINVFEKTVSYVTTAHNSITNMAVLLKTALNENTTFTEQQSKDIFERLDKNIQLVYQATQEIAGSIDLYVDLKHDEKEVEDAQKFWELLGMINQLAIEVNYGYDLLPTATNKEEYDKMIIAIGLHTKELEKNVGNLLALSNAMKKKYLAMISLLREQLKTYE